MNSLQLRDDEYAVTWPPGQHRGAGGPDPIRAAQSTVGGLALRVNQGIGLLRATADFGFRLVRFRAVPLALQVGPLGRTQASAATAPPVVLRMRGEDVAIESESVDAAFPHATDQLVVFVPGADEAESIWAAKVNQVGGTYGSRLATILDWTPVHLRTESAFSTAQTGVALSALLQGLVDAWPTEVRRLALVGHGSGGLVIRAACGMQALTQNAWTDLVTDVLLLGTPHLVAPAQGVGLVRHIDEKLAGITTSDRANPDLLPLPGVRYILVTDELISSKNRVGRMFGDLLWWRQRATLRPRQARPLFPTAEHHSLSTKDLPLVNHPEVHRALLAWLA